VDPLQHDYLHLADRKGPAVEQGKQLALDHLGRRHTRPRIRNQGFIAIVGQTTSRGRRRNGTVPQAYLITAHSAAVGDRLRLRRNTPLM
jgi:hypothetical protein